MAPSAVLLQPLTTPTPSNLTNHTMSSLHTNHNYSSLTDFTGGPSTSHFGVYQKTSVGTSDVTMRTLVPAAIGAEPYRKALIAKLFFRQILPLTDATYVSFSNLITTVSLYFSINTGSSERESAAAVVSIRSNFFLVTNLQEVGFTDTFGKPVNVPDPTQRPTDLTYFTFRAVVPVHLVNKRAPEKNFIPRVLTQVTVTLSASGGNPNPNWNPNNTNSSNKIEYTNINNKIA